MTKADRMRQFLFVVLLGTGPIALAQFPPIDVEWTALRSFGSSGSGAAQITRDPIHGDHMWAVPDDIMLTSMDDELLYPILSDGTDLAPAFPYTVNVGSLDHLVDMARYDGTTYMVIGHQNIGGDPQDSYWHLSAGVNELTIQSPGSDLDDVAVDLLVDADGAFIAGSSRVQGGAMEGRLIHTDHSANMIWDASWSPNGTLATGRFTSIVVKGDSVLAIAYPLAVIFNKVDGAYIGQVDFTQGNAVTGTSSATAAGRGEMLYWTAATPSGLTYGSYHLTDAIGTMTTQTLGGGLNGQPCIVLDGTGMVWIAYNHAGEGHWIKADAEALAMDSGTLYSSITDMCGVNGRVLFTGQFDATQGSTYVVCGTPQP